MALALALALALASASASASHSTPIPISTSTSTSPWALPRRSDLIAARAAAERVLDRAHDAPRHSLAWRKSRKYATLAACLRHPFPFRTSGAASDEAA
ncbi:hypothetical protein [Burkholderia pseudomallei]|uniref:hypothetical protein n=1 Tax=Burkholderia pseudomallei TaxID=28450 RepID=UPI0015C3BBC1|nr:hypothetical protein [Burkholderia pseudomallei]MBF4042131.1 hypothetical protein [Burkholderia pseudomallei]